MQVPSGTMGALKGEKYQTSRVVTLAASGKQRGGHLGLLLYGNCLSSAGWVIHGYLVFSIPVHISEIVCKFKRFDSKS